MFWYGMSACVLVWYERVCLGMVCARLYWFGMSACVLVWYERVCLGMV